MDNSVNQADIQQSILNQQKADSRRKHVLNLVLLVLLILAPAVMYPVFLMKILCFALFAVAFNLLLGFTGLLSFGHAAFLATGAYTTGYLLSTYSSLSTEMGIFVGTAASTLRAGLRAGCHSPPGHLLRDDHSGIVATGVFLLRAIGIHRW